MKGESQIIEAARAIALRRAVCDPVKQRHRATLMNLMEEELAKLSGAPTPNGKIDVARFAGPDVIWIVEVIQAAPDGEWSVYNRLSLVELEVFDPQVRVTEELSDGGRNETSHHCAGEAVRQVVEIVSNHIVSS